MTSFKVLSCLLTVALAAVCHADIKCTSVCPDYLWPLDETIIQSISYNFERPGPQDGVCRPGTQKYIFVGSNFGSKENRCVCVTTPPSKYRGCGDGVPTCPSMPQAFANELNGEFYQRVGRELSGGPADGCCPDGGLLWISEPQYTGAENNLCFCVARANPELQ